MKPGKNIRSRRWSGRLALGLGLLILLAAGGLGWMRGDASQAEAAVTLSRTYLPATHNKYPPTNPFGLEAFRLFYPGNYITNYASGLKSSYARLNDRISWMDLQPNEGDSINWALLANFEIELRTMKTAHIVPIVVVDEYPRWATDNTVRDDGNPTSCGPLLLERYDDFAAFMQALVDRYSTPEFEVHIWELGNEVDVDPNEVAADNNYGCWGDWDELFYNGDAYGDMLKVVTPAIKAIDPEAQAWIGGLLLYRPDSALVNHIGRPELFLEGILSAGAGEYFDVVPYHVYIGWFGATYDHDLYDANWAEWGGIMRGKGNFLREIMARYGVDKPLFISESSEICRWCEETNDPEIIAQFYDMQANLPARALPRILDNDVTGYVWYTLDGPGWELGGLLDAYQKPKPVYYAYQTLIRLTRSATLVGQTSIWEGVEVYTYYEADKQIQIMFTVDDIPYPLLTPQSGFVAAYDRFGVPLSLEAVDGYYQLNLQYQPIYLVRER